MSKTSITVNVNASTEQVWRVISNYGNVHIYNPLVERTSILSSNDRGLGAKRLCDFFDKTSVVEEVTQWDEGKGFTAVLSEGSMPLKTAHVTMRVISTGHKTSDVTIEMEYDVKFGPMGKLMDVLMMRNRIKMMFKKVLKGLDDHITSGEIIGKNGVPQGV